MQSQGSLDFDVIVVGGGAAGFFTAISCAEQAPELKIAIFEASKNVLAKVKISGGGRANVTHHEYDPKKLVKNYPRGAKELLGPLHHFGPKQTVDWFANKNIKLHIEADGRMFPVTNSSQTVIDLFTSEVKRLGIRLFTGMRVLEIVKENDSLPQLFKLKTRDGEEFRSKTVVLATGSSPEGYEIARSLNFNIVSPVPSLFTFKIDDPELIKLSGISLGKEFTPQLELVTGGAEQKSKKDKTSFRAEGPLLITHWGMSGPGILRLSAFAARMLHTSGYQAKLVVHWVNPLKTADVESILRLVSSQHPKKKVKGHSIFPQGMPLRLWEYLVSKTLSNSSEEKTHLQRADKTFAELSRDDEKAIVRTLVSDEFKVFGRGIFKEEFVTAGGIALEDVDFRTMESRKLSGVYAAGEILDIDGVTGGFNFQNAWTTGYIAARAIGLKHKSLKS